MSHQSVSTRIKEEEVSGSAPSAPVQSTSSGICIKQEYFEDQLLMTRTIKTESESAPNEHNIMQSIKVEVKEEHYDDQDCVVKCELDFDEGEQIDRKIKVEVGDVSNEHSVQLCEWIKKEEDEDDHEEARPFYCDCGEEECEKCKVKREIKEEFYESGCETELGAPAVQGCIRVKKEKEDSEGEGERPKKMLQYVSSGQLVQHVKTESESAPNEHNIMQSIKVEVKEEHYHDQDCVVKCELDFDEGEQIDTKIKVKDDSSGQPIQLGELVKKEDDDGGEYVIECDCGECEICRVKREIKDETDESGFETELGGNSGETVQGFTRVKKEEGEDDGEVERPYKIPRMDRVVGNVPIGSPSPSPTVYSHNVVSINVEGLDDQVANSSTNPITIEDQIQPSQPVTLPTPNVTPTQSSSSAQHVNEPLRDESLNGEPMMDNVALVVHLGAEEFDREQVDEDNSTFNPMRTDQDEEEEGYETIEERDAPSAGAEQQVQVSAENFVKRIEPADELGNRFECDYHQCGRRMKHRSNLIRHIRSHTGEKPIKCSVEGCDRAFVQKGDLKAHLNVHSGDRLFVCTWPRCDARFGNKCNLTAHTRTHTGARPFVCTWPDCGQAFAQSNHLKSHSIVHSNERQFVCDVRGCTKVYKRKDALLRHQKDKHN